MMSTHDETHRAQSPAQYRIGTVAQLTGLTADTIRMWERRYKTLKPARSRGGTRLYSDSDVTRLQLLRALTASGHPISRVASLSTEAMRARLEDSASRADTEHGAVPLRVAVLDAALARAIRERSDGSLEVVHAGESLEAFAAGLAATPVDALVLPLEPLGDAPLAALRRCQEIARARVVLVIHELAPRAVLARLAATGAKLVRGPVAPEALHRVLGDLAALSAAENGTEPADTVATPVGQAESRFNGERLARLRQCNGDPRCSCFRDTAELIAALNAAEEYALKCDSADDEPGMHDLLARAAIQARAQIETLLERVLSEQGRRI